MNEPASQHERSELLRAYLLGTLDPAEAARVETALSEDPEWRAELERQRAALAMLDALPQHEPPASLATRTIALVREERTERQRKRSARVTFAQVALLVTVTGIVAAVFLPALARSREASRRASSQNNLKQLAIVMKMYANENPGEAYPPLTPYDGLWMFDVERIYPEFLTDLTVLVNPSLPDASELLQRMNELASQEPPDYREITHIAAKSYVYPGWVVQSDDEAEALDDAMRRVARADLGDQLETEAGILRRAREGVERFLITDINNPAGSASAQSEIPILFEAVPDGGFPKRRGAGVNVAYMDGHVEYLAPGSGFPATDTARRVFGE
jgi:prepilin-type processing-associated H-X9-DG protein